MHKRFRILYFTNKRPMPCRHNSFTSYSCVPVWRILIIRYPRLWYQWRRKARKQI